jgi:hypothetical protein
VVLSISILLVLVIKLVSAIRRQHEQNETVYQTQCSSEGLSACGASYRIVASYCITSLCVWLIVVCIVMFVLGKYDSNQQIRKGRICTKERK